MLEHPVTAWIAGTLLGFLAGLGIGGGSLLLLWLTTVLQMDQKTAQGINLLFFLPAAFVSLLRTENRTHRDLGKYLPAIASGCLAAAVFSLLGKHIDTAVLKKLFGGIFIAVGMRELFYRPRNAR